MRRHRHGRDRARGFGGGLVGGIVGGMISGAIVSSGNQGSSKSSPAPSPALEAVLKRVTQVPVGGTAFLKVEEYRLLADKGLIQFKETVPYCMERIIEV